MTEIEVIQEIHGLFEFRPNGDELLKNKPEKMSSELFLSLAEKYRFYYPANNFVTERQVAEICKTYNLVCGPELLFSESIPKRSVHEPCFTLIAKMDKRPPCLVSAETRATYGPFPVLSQEVYADESIPVIDRIVLFMQANGLSDIRMRMLTVQELKEIQGLGPDYVLKGSQANQKKFIGNAVVPHVVKAWAEAYWRETFSVVQPQALQLF